jgi:polyhydroxyalkanoate synthesis regulator phasin
MWPQANISLEEFQRRRPYLDPNVVSKILQDQATRVSDERIRQATERKELTDPLVKSLESGRGAGSAARKFGALQKGIASMMNNPSGALVGLITAGGPVLDEIGKITQEDAKFEADLAVKIFGIRKADLTEAHKAALQTIIEDGNVQKTLLELPGRAHKEYLDELVKRSTIAANEAKRIAAGKDKGKLTATVDKRLASMASGAFGFQAVLNEKGNLQIMDGDVLVSPKDNKKVTGKITKLLKAYGRNRKLGKDESTAIADSFTEVFPGKPVPEVEEVKVEVKQEPTTALTPNIHSFGGRPRPKKQ